jgi:PAS domain S-box-containing protein
MNLVSASPLVYGLAVVAGLVAGVLLARRRWAGAARPSTDGVASRRSALRARALDATADAVLLVSADGLVQDCNAAALALFGRDRQALEGRSAESLRTLYEGAHVPATFERIVAARGPWQGMGHVRLPDGSRIPCATRLIPEFASDGRVDVMVEVHDGSRPPGTRGIGHAALLLPDVPLDSGPVTPGVVRRDLRFLEAAFEELGDLIDQYERLLPALSADDPVTEEVAGLAAETRERATAADLPRLMREIPRAIARLDRRARDGGPAGTPGGRGI